MTSWPGWEPDYTLEAPEGHMWMKPAPVACEGCECCTAALCEQAHVEDRACWAVLGSTLRIATPCPCSAAIEERKRAEVRARQVAGGHAFAVDLSTHRPIVVGAPLELRCGHCGLTEDQARGEDGTVRPCTAATDEDKAVQA